MQILNACHNKLIPNMFYAHGFVFDKFHFDFHYFFIKNTLHVFSFGAMFPTLFYNTRM